MTIRAANDAQLGLAIADPPDAEDDGDDQALLHERLITACRAVARTLTYERCAASLDAIWGSRGRPVSASVLRAALSGTERNYFRSEWVTWFARRSEEVADVVNEMAGRPSPKKAPEEELRDLKALIREELPKRAATLIRKAELP